MICQSGYYQLRQLQRAVQSLSQDADCPDVKMQTVQAFVSCRLDYCNSLFLGICKGLMSQLQSVQNAAARLVTGTRRCNHIMPVLRLLLLWLSVHQRINFKVASHSSIGRCLVICRRTYLTTVVLLPMLMSDGYTQESMCRYTDPQHRC